MFRIGLNVGFNNYKKIRAFFFSFIIPFKSDLLPQHQQQNFYVYKKYPNEIK